MAIAQRGSATVAHGNDTAVPAKPTGVVSGDVLVAFVANDAGLTAPIVTGPTGWTKQLDSNDDGSNSVRTQVWTRVADGTEGTTFTWTQSGGFGLEMVAHVTAWSGGDNATPADVAAAGNVVSGIAGTTSVAPSLTTVTDNALLLCCYTLDNGGADLSAATVTLPAGLTDQGYAVTGTTTIKLRVGTKTATPAGATGTQTATTTSLPIRVGQSVALRPVAPDTTPPVISGVVSVTPGDTFTTVSWVTDEPASSQAEYGTTTGYGATTPLDSALVLNHSAYLDGLTPSTLYHYRVKSADAASNLATGTDNTFTTGATPTAPPTAARPHAVAPLVARKR